MIEKWLLFFKISNSQTIKIVLVKSIAYKRLIILEVLIKAFLIIKKFLDLLFNIKNNQFYKVFHKTKSNHKKLINLKKLKENINLQNRFMDRCLNRVTHNLNLNTNKWVYNKVKWYNNHNNLQTINRVSKNHNLIKVKNLKWFMKNV